MVKIIFSLAMALGSYAFAEHMDSVNPNETTCAEMQQILAQDGHIEVDGFAGGTNYYVASRDMCDMLHIAVPNYIRSQDKNFCRVGFACLFNDKGQ